MTLLNTINVGGTDFGLLNNTVMGVCNTPAGSEVKACTFADSFELKAGVVVTIKFTYANTYGDGSTTYPKLSVNGTPYPIKYATNAYAGAGAWINGQTVPFMFDGTGFILVANLMQTSVISSANTTVNGAPLYNGANVKVMFTAALTGVDTSTALVLNYNSSNITVKVPVNGALVDYTAKAVDESGTTAYYYCQAYTTLELLFDGTYFVITNNPVVISNSDYVINADGLITYSKSGTDTALQYKSKARALWVEPNHSVEIDIADNELIQIDAMFYDGVAERALFSKMLNLAPVKKTLFSDASPGHSMSIEGNKIILTATSLDVILFDVLYLFKY